MKKILIATTALVATTSIAAAELNFSGNARFGIAYGENATNAAGEEQETRIEQRVRLQASGSAESDAGVKFSARIRAEAGEAADSSISGGGFGAAEFTVQSGGFRLDIGNTSDVIDSGDAFSWAGAAEPGLTFFIGQNAAFGFDFVGGFGSGDADATTLKLKYEAGDFVVAASYSKDEKSTAATTASLFGSAATAEALADVDLPDEPTTVSATGLASTNDITEWQIGAGYSFGDYNVGGALGSVDTAGTDNDFWVIGFNGSVGAVNFSAIIGDEDAADDAAYGFSVGYELSAATTIEFAYSDGGLADAEGGDAAIAIGFRHSLGGGVSLAGGIGEDVEGNSIADLGVSFSF